MGLRLSPISRARRKEKSPELKGKKYVGVGKCFLITVIRGEAANGFRAMTG